MKTTDRRFAALSLAALAVAPLAAAACSSPYGSVAPPPPAVTTTTIEGASTPALTKASDLRAKLTYLMVEHAFALGRAVLEQVHAIPADDATAATDANTKDIGDLLDQAYGGTFGTQFAKLWSARAASFEAYAAAKASGSTGGASAAVSDLASNVTGLAQLVHATNKYLEVHTVTNPPTGIGDELTTINTSYTAFVDAAASNDATTYAKLVTAAEAMPHTAEMLAAATAKLLPTTYPGTAFGTAANLRSSLTELGVEHVELVALGSGAAAAGKDAASETATLNANTAELHNAFAAIYDDATAQKFDDLWGAQVQAYVAEAKAHQAGDTSGQGSAKAGLDAFALSFGDFLHGDTAGRVPSSTIANALSTQVHAVEGVIDGAGSAADTASRVRAAVGAVPAWIAAFSEAVTEQFPTRFLP